LYLDLLDVKLENVIAEIMAENERGKPFENLIGLVSGQKVPEIITNKFYGWELKTISEL